MPKLNFNFLNWGLKYTAHLIQSRKSARKLEDMHLKLLIDKYCLHLNAGITRN